MTTISRTFMTIALLVAASALASRATHGENTRLEDDKLRVEVDRMGRVVYLENKASDQGNVIDRPGDAAFGMVCKRGRNWEAVVFPDRQQYKVSKEGNTIKTVIEKVKTDDDPNELTLTMTVTLRDGKLLFGAELDNREKDLLVTEFRYPRVAVVKSLGSGKKPDLLWPRQTGMRISNFGTGQHLGETYPGPLSMQWTALTDESETLYLSGRDDKIYTTSLNAESGVKNGIELAFTRFLFVKSGEKRIVPETLLQLYSGTWHRAADEYRAWASTWRKIRPRVDWARDMIGYFLVINKQQYGDEMWSYDRLPKLYELAQAHGFDTLGLFGWYEGGHDNTYPDIEVGKTLGGPEMLRKNIQKIREAGGNVTLYVQGHLIDPTSEFYQRHGKAVEGHSHWGMPYHEHYNKFGRSDFLRHFTTKVFSTACPSSPIWRDRMIENVEFIHSLGAGGVLYDQIGGMPPKPCFNDDHPHLNGCPGLSYVPGRLRLLNDIRAETRKTDGNFAFFTEHVTDAYSQYADVLHGIGESPSAGKFSEMFRYCFPETIITIRNPAPYISSAHTNFAATYGLAMEMEIRYRDDCDHVLEDRSRPQREYARKVAELRKEYRNVLRGEHFVDDKPFLNGNSNLKCKAFQAGDRIGVVLWNHGKEPQGPELTVPGYRLVESAQPESSERPGKLPDSIPPSRIAVAVYEKE